MGRRRPAIAHLDDDTTPVRKDLRPHGLGRRADERPASGIARYPRIAPNLWAGVGLVRGGAGTALVGNPQQVAERIREYQALGISNFIFSGYPHLKKRTAC